MPEDEKKDVSPKKPDRAHLFQPGQSGNPKGRPPGSRGKLGEAFLKALQEDFHTHGVKAIEEVRVKKPEAYLKVIAMTLPKQMTVSVDPVEELSDAELDRYIKQLATSLAIEVRASESAEGETDTSKAQQVKPVQTLQ